MQINIVHADTQGWFNSTGPGGSRFTVMVAGAIVGASEDALGSFGVRCDELPLTQRRVRELV